MMTAKQVRDVLNDPRNEIADADWVLVGEQTISIFRYQPPPPPPPPGQG